MHTKKRKIIPYNPELKLIARELRNNSTKSEIFLWLKLKGRQMRGYDFHRQKPLGNYIVDFFCHELMLAIELDGFSHHMEEVYDKDLTKTRSIEAMGVKIIRFDDMEVYYDIFNVLRTIEAYIDEYEAKS